MADLASSFNALPLAPQAASPVANSGSSAAAPAEVSVPVPLDDPGFGAALGTQVSVMVRDGVQTARLQLHPAEMGPIAVQIALDGSAARVDFQADLAGTRAVIEASLPALAGALQDAGFTLAGGGVFQQTPGQQGQGDQPANPGQARHADGNSAAGSPLPVAPVVQRTQRGLVDLVA
jgi:flagellar hook-length control protein FliK